MIYGLLAGLLAEVVRGQMAEPDASTAVAGGVPQTSRTKRDVQYLEERLKKLLLVSAALWELLKERTDLTEEDLLAKVQEVDLMDGAEDGKVTRKVLKCHKCGRTMSPRHHKCLYCGAAEKDLGAFDAAT